MGACGSNTKPKTLKDGHEQITDPKAAIKGSAPPDLNVKGEVTFAPDNEKISISKPAHQDSIIPVNTPIDMKAGGVSVNNKNLKEMTPQKNASA